MNIESPNNKANEVIWVWYFAQSTSQTSYEEGSTEEKLANKGVDFVSLKECIDTATPQGKFMLTVFGAMAELERESILERQREGIAVAKEQGLYKGRQKMKIDKDEFKSVVKEWRDNKITAVKAMEQLGLKPNTFYRRVKEWGL